MDLESVFSRLTYETRFAHYMDPMLRVILESSLTPDDNDLHLSNIAHTPVLAVHGCVPQLLMLQQISFSCVTEVLTGTSLRGTHGSL
jgi:hypothetical protein